MDKLKIRIAYASARRRDRSRSTNPNGVRGRKPRCTRFVSQSPPPSPLLWLACPIWCRGNRRLSPTARHARHRESMHLRSWWLRKTSPVSDTTPTGSPATYVTSPDRIRDFRSGLVLNDRKPASVRSSFLAQEFQTIQQRQRLSTHS
jgi:hypothetical protein